MVAVLYIREDIGILQLLFKRFGNSDVINAPAFIIQSYRRETLAPPAVPVRLRVKLPERIDPAAV